MGKSILSLRFPDLTNEGILLIEDTSTYNPDITPTCPNLQITPPGYKTPASIDPLTTGFRLVLNSCTLGISSPGDCSTNLPNIQDGPYYIRYSISPNDKVYVEYWYMRTVKAMNRWNELLCALKIPCCLPDQEMVYAIQQLYLIRAFIDSAKVTVEECGHNIQEGVNQLRYANALMAKMSARRPGCAI